MRHEYLERALHEAYRDAGRRTRQDAVEQRTWELLQAWVTETSLSGVEVTPEGYADEWLNCRAMANAELPEGFEPLASEPVPHVVIVDAYQQHMDRLMEARRRMRGTNRDSRPTDRPRD